MTSRPDKQQASAKPGSLRKRQQALSRNIILDAAAELFIKRGYRRTTMQAIADQAGVGVATVFRYFPKKAGILAAISQRDMESVLEECRQILKQPPADPVQSTIGILFSFLKLLDMPSSGFRWQTDLWLPVQTGQPEADAVVSWADREIQVLLKKLLQPFQKLGIIDPTIKINDIVTIIFCVFNQQILTFATTPSISKTQLKKDFARQIPILFQSWVR